MFQITGYVLHKILDFNMQKGQKTFAKWEMLAKKSNSSVELENWIKLKKWTKLKIGQNWKLDKIEN